MAVLWSNIVNGVKYEVRNAGNSIRLYTDDVFHTQWNPSKPLNGHVWDLLFLSTCFLKEANPFKNALILGVGCGAVLCSIHHFYPETNVVGVDLDGVHLKLAKKFFIKNKSNIELHQACAAQYIHQNAAKYDLIIEDLFSGVEESGKIVARKAIDVDKRWLTRLIARLTKSGVLAINFESKAQCKYWLKPKVLKELGIGKVHILTQEKYENVIAVLTKNPVNKSDVSKRWSDFCERHPRKDTAACTFDIQPL